MRKVAVGLLILGVVFIGGLFISGTSNEGPIGNIKSYLEHFNKDYQIYAIPLEESLHFAGEEVNLSDFEVRERIDRELLVNSYWQSSSLQFIKKANRWFPLIEEILKEEEVPDDFKYLPLIESGFRNVTSPAGARGFWQFLKATAQSYGLEVNSAVDERYHVEKATRAACAYLKDAKEKFGTWTMAAASYNMGMAGLQKQIDLQNTSDYYNLYLNEETSRYVPRLIAVKQILSSPNKYGFNFRAQDLYAPLKGRSLTIDTTIQSLPAFCATQGISYKHLKVYNPWLRSTSLPNKSRRSYVLIIPNAKDLEAVMEEDDVISTFSNGAFNKTPSRDQESYRVKNGDTWLSISSELGIDIMRLRKINPDVDQPIEGQLIKLDSISK